MIFVYIFLFYFVVIFIFFNIIRHLLHCRDKEWIDWCEYNKLNVTEYPEYGFDKGKKANLAVADITLNSTTRGDL